MKLRHRLDTEEYWRLERFRQRFSEIRNLMSLWSLA
jgi:hypothetical protein